MQQGPAHPETEAVVHLQFETTVYDWQGAQITLICFDELTLMAPFRMRNLTTLDIEQNLVRLGQGRALHIVIGGEEVKNGEPPRLPASTGKRRPS